MVRTTIACARCRKAKTKCVHSGFPPCKSCAKSDSATINLCVLTGPVLKRKRSQAINEPAIEPTTIADQSASLSREVQSSTNPEVRERYSRSPSRRSRVRLEKGSTGEHRHFLYVATRAANIFVVQFPELDFLHIPTFLQQLKEFEVSLADNSRHDGSDYATTKFGGFCCALVALCSPWLDGHCPHEDYAHSARLSISIEDSPEILAVQTLLLLAMYEWGGGKTHVAWAYSGMAIRSMQMLNVTQKGGQAKDLHSEICNRTFWSCFVMDRLVFSGKPQPLALPLSSMKVHWPIGQRDFAFGGTSSRTYPHDINDGTGLGDLDGFYTLLVQGYDIWARVLSWIARGGRRQLSANQEIETPWVPGSTWRSLYDDLETWRGKHRTSIQFPGTAVEVFVSLGKTTQFAYLNLIYHLCRLFLGREYIPFLPTTMSEPSGPVDPPLLSQVPPPNWWKDRSNDLFSSSAGITDILRRLDVAGVPLFTPFSGFCAFSAATMNIYAACFPRMNLGRSPNATADVEADLLYLNRFRARWAIGARWLTTIEHTRHLYEKASRDRDRYLGKTRDDFSALEASIHDCVEPPAVESRTSTSEKPPGDERDRQSGYLLSRTHDDHQTTDGNDSAIETTDLQSQLSPRQDTELYYNEKVNELTGIWPLWEEQQEFLFSFGIPWADASR